MSSGTDETPAPGAASSSEPLGEPVKEVEAAYDYYAIVDFECTCEHRDQGGQGFPHEIIEFPVVFLNARTLKVDFEFHRFVRPVEMPVLTRFCTELTGIQQPDVDSAEPLEQVLQEFQDFLREHGLVSRRGDRSPDKPLFVLCTDGPWDFNNFIRPEARRKGLTLAGYWDRYVDVRRHFAEAFNRRKRCGVQGMLALRGLEFEGREHSGIDDSRNIARLVAELLSVDFPLKFTEAR